MNDIKIWLIVFSVLTFLLAISCFYLLIENNKLQRENEIIRRIMFGVGYVKGKKAGAKDKNSEFTLNELIEAYGFKPVENEEVFKDDK